MTTTTPTTKATEKFSRARGHLFDRDHAKTTHLEVYSASATGGPSGFTGQGEAVVDSATGEVLDRFAFRVDALARQAEIEDAREAEGYVPPAREPDPTDGWQEKINAAREAVEAADAAFYADPDDDAKRKAYEAAKKDYRAIERAAFADGFYWTCGRCGGSGRWVNGGVCFNCGGSGFHPNQNPHKFEASPRVRHKREAEHRAKRAAEDAAFDESLRKVGGEVEAKLREAVAKFERLGGYYHESGEELTKDETFAYNLSEKLKKYGSLSERQVAAVQRGIDREKRIAAEQEALKSVAPLVEGRYVIEGEVASTRDPDPDAQFPAVKMLVKLDDGNKVWGTVPRALEELTFPTQSDEDGTWQDAELAELRGARVRFTATVERSKDDEHFGFFNRPTKAGLVKGGQDG